jgi:hypothetical protein
MHAPCARANHDHCATLHETKAEQVAAAKVYMRTRAEGDHSMSRLVFVTAALASLMISTAVAETLSPEADACKASGLLALKQKYPQVKDVLIDLDSAKIIKADTTIENVPIKTVVIGDAYVERTKTTKPQTLVCVIGDKGKVLLTLFSDK